MSEGLVVEGIEVLAVGVGLKLLGQGYYFELLVFADV
mgnify:CR=1 FL=1